MVLVPLSEPSSPLGCYRQMLRFGEGLLGRGLLFNRHFKRHESQSVDSCYSRALGPPEVLWKKPLAVRVPCASWGAGGLW